MPHPVDAERVRDQLRRWQERLLDLTKANPLYQGVSTWGLTLGRSRQDRPPRPRAPRPRMAIMSLALFSWPGRGLRRHRALITVGAVPRRWEER